MEIVIKSLDKAIKDPKLIVRKLAIRGYGLIGSLDENIMKSLESEEDANPLAVTALEQLKLFIKQGVEAALVGLDDSGDRSDQLAIEAVDALDRLVSVADTKLIITILPQLLLKIRPCFEKV